MLIDFLYRSKLGTFDFKFQNTSNFTFYGKEYLESMYNTSRGDDSELEDEEADDGKEEVTRAINSTD